MTECEVGGLRCSEVLAELSEYVDGELSAERSSQIEAHLMGCSNCERFGASFSGVVRSLRDCPEPGPLTSELRARIQAAAEERR